LGSPPAPTLFPYTTLFRSEERGHPGLVHARLARAFRKPAARERWRDDIERIVRIAAVRRGVGEQREELRHLEERARPAMQEQDRNRVRPAPRLAKEMQTEAVDVRQKVGKRVEALLLRAPVEAVAPVSEQLAQVVEVRAVIPGAAGDLVGPPCAVDAVAEVRERVLR